VSATSKFVPAATSRRVVAPSPSELADLRITATLWVAFAATSAVSVSGVTTASIVRGPVPPSGHESTRKVTSVVLPPDRTSDSQAISRVDPSDARERRHAS
jgi:hypothetical protein